MTEFSRRDFLALTGTAVASVWLTVDPRAIAELGRQAASAQQFQVLSASDAADIEAAMAQIIPSDETPGAREARVIYFLDRALGTIAKGDKPLFVAGAKELRERAAKIHPRAKSFAALPSATQIRVLESLEKDKSPFFELLRGTTIAGMLANPEYGGNYRKFGWQWIGFEDRFSWGPPFGWYDRNV